MDFRRSQLDDRRRRVLMEEVTAPAEGEESTAAPAVRRAPTRAYPDGTLTDRQPRISDLVPTRPFVVMLLILVLLTGVAAIETLYIHWQTSPAPVRAAGEAALGREQLAAIDLAARGNLASWYSALLLAAGACGGLVIFSIRCHRVDDYHGRYRVWLWTVAALLWASLDSVTEIHEAIGATIGLIAGSARLANVGWLTLYMLVFGVLAIRLGIETWHAVSSFSTLSLSAVLYLVAGMTSVGWIPLPGYLLATVLQTTIIMLAHVTLVAGLVLYARHIHLDAQGKLPLRLRTQGPKPKRKPRARLGVVSDDEKAAADESKVAAKASSAASGSSGTYSSAAKPAASSARSGPLASRVAASISQDDDDDDADDSDAGESGGERLSKAERRRLKKLMRQQRRAA
jgi:hypothetical protein